MKFRTLEEKLDAKLTKFTENKKNQFTSKKVFIEYLTEGAILNINKLCSEIFSIPYGKYVVWELNDSNASLVPLGTSNDILPSLDKPYDIITQTLVNNWDKIFTEDESDDGTEFVSQVDMSSVDRLPLARALEDRGMTVTELARACDVDPPAISRILRKPNSGAAGDPGGRNPSMALASKICAVLRLDPRAAFPDFFRADPSHEARKPPKNRGSGKNGYGASE
jgi:hypothetical protein